MNTKQISEELPVEFVRWFYYHSNSSGYPWKRFSGSDTLKIEKTYRTRKLKLSQKSSNEVKNLNSKVVVRGDLFLVDVDTLMCEPIFWSGNKRSVHSRSTDWCSSPVKRGIWFNKINWIPLDQELSLAIETEHVKYVIPELLAVANGGKSKRKIHSYRFGDMKVIWMGSEDIFLVTKAANPFPRIRLRGDLSSIPIARGYNKEAVISDAKPSITHICFVVHGIGQQLASIRHECSKIRQACNRIIMKHYPSLYDSGRRLEFIPVDWRSDLPLNHDTLNNITVGQMRPLRSYINNCFVDILYYTSSYYRTEILRSLKWELMRQYNLFLQYNPHFLQTGGHVSVIAHSLGSVLMYDLLKENSPPLNSSISFQSAMGESINEPNSSDDIRRQIEDARSELYELENKLVSQVSASSQRPYATRLTNLFMIGSPLALFIAVNSGPGNHDWLTDNWVAPDEMRAPIFVERSYSSTNGTSAWNRNRTPSQGSYEENSRAAPVFNLNQSDPNALIPYRSCKRIFNIFHSYDPIAYRIEPLLLKHYSNISPLVLPSVDSYFQKKNRVDRHTVSTLNLNGESSTPAKPQSPTRVRFRLPDSRTSSLTSDSSELEGGGGRRSTLHQHASEGALHELQSPARTARVTPARWQSSGAGLRDLGTERYQSRLAEEFEWSSRERSELAESSRTASTDSVEETFAQKVYRRLSVVANTTVYKQHQSRAFKLFSRYLVRRSSHVTSLEPQTSTQQPSMEGGPRLDYRVDYEWQKSFAPLAVLGAHNSYWSSKDLAFFIVYQLFGRPEPC